MILQVKLVDMVILMVTLLMVGLIVYSKFFKKERGGHCSGCVEIAKAKKMSSGMKKYYEKIKEMEQRGCKKIN